MKLAAFDLEIAKQAPADAGDLRRFAPLGITCAAVAFADTAEPTFWQGVPQLTRPECQDMVRELQEFVRSGYTLVTWNGCAFDFWVLAQESGMIEECGALALNHVDLMLMVTFTKGYYLGLDRALQGAGAVGGRRTRGRARISARGRHRVAETGRIRPAKTRPDLAEQSRHAPEHHREAASAGHRVFRHP